MFEETRKITGQDICTITNNINNIEINYKLINICISVIYLLSSILSKHKSPILISTFMDESSF